MDAKKIAGQFVAPLTFVAAFAAGLEIKRAPRDGADVAGEFTERYEFRVLAVRADSPPGAPRYVSLTLEQLGKPGADAGVSFLLPSDRVELRGGKHHRVAVLERRADRQLVEYRYVRGKLLETYRYVAFERRVEPVSGSVRSYLIGLSFAVVLLVPATLWAGVAALTWRFGVVAASPQRPSKAALALQGAALAVLHAACLGALLSIAIP